MSAQRGGVNVLAVMDNFIDPDHYPHQPHDLTEARAAVAEQQRILRQLAAWNRNPNGDGVELDELCAAAEVLVGRAGESEPRHGIEQLATVAGFVAALEEIRDYEGDPRSPVRNSVKKSAIARAALHAARMDPQPGENT